MADSLKGKEILLAGGSGGLGAAVTAQLVEEGAQVVLSFHRKRERAALWEDRATVVQADLSAAEDRTRLLAAVPNLYGLVIFAGDPARVTSPEQLPDAMARSHQINYLGPVLLARDAALQMKSRGMEGAIVLFSTMQANSLLAGFSPYADQKVALQHSARSLAKEFRAPWNIRINVVSPGIIAAGMAESSIASGKYDRMISDNVIGRFGRAGDIARAVRFLLEPDNYVTGQVLCVDGGLTLGR